MSEKFTESDNRIFHAAITSNDAATVGDMVAKGISVESIVDGVSPLYAAACLGECNRHGMIKLLVAAGADPNRRMLSTERAAELRTALNGAAASAYLGPMNLLLDYGADPRLADDFDRTAAHLLIEQATDSLVEMAGPACHVIARMLDKGVPVNHPDGEGSTLLHYAIRARWPEVMVDLLLDRGADINARDDDGCTPLNYAHDVEVARMLLDRGADIRNIDNKGQGVFHRRVSQALIGDGGPDVALYLLQRGALSNQEDFEGRTAQQAVASATDHDDYDAAQALQVALSTLNARAAIQGVAARVAAGVDPARVPESATTNLRPLTVDARNAFHLAAVTNDAATIRDLLAAGMTPETPLGSVRPLFSAARNPISDSPEIIDLLVGAGADPNRKTAGHDSNWDPRTPLNGAALAGNLRVAARLLDHGADPRITDGIGRTAAHILLQQVTPAFADEDGVCSVLGRLLDSGILINQRDEDGRTVLHNAIAARWHLPVVSAVLDRGADINARDRKGRTALYYAEDPTLVRALIERGADINSIDSSGKTAFHVLVEKGSLDLHGTLELPLLMLQNGANPRQPDKSGITALQILEYPDIATMPAIRTIRAAIAACDASVAMREAIRAPKSEFRP
jgi:ankyrin repeat protein